MLFRCPNDFSHMTSVSAWLPPNDNFSSKTKRQFRPSVLGVWILQWWPLNEGCKILLPTPYHHIYYSSLVISRYCKFSWAPALICTRCPSTSSLSYPVGCSILVISRCSTFSWAPTLRSMRCYWTTSRTGWWSIRAKPSTWWEPEVNTDSIITPPIPLTHSSPRPFRINTDPVESE